MAAIDDLINQIPDELLRGRIREELARMGKRNKFGLVFENHLPECTCLYDYEIQPGRLVARKSGPANELYKVLQINGNEALCLRRHSEKICHFPLNDLVVAAEFGDPVYPYLKPVDSICNAPDSDLWHILIEADNYHALQLLDYLYHGKVDCIYIDPPYNTGARDWKYNNDYVDSSDAYRHSKWLSMMEKRLKLAKRLLKPDTGVLIVTIDEHEVHHLRTLLEQIFPEFYIQMVTDVVMPAGVTQDRFSRVEEYNIFCFAKNAYVNKSSDNLLNSEIDESPANQYKSVLKPRWRKLLRSGEGSSRADRKSMFYPILIDAQTHRVIKACEPLPYHLQPELGAKINGYDAAWPVRNNDSTLGRWSVGHETLNSLIKKGFVSSGKYDAKRKTYGIKYLSEQSQNLINSGEIRIVKRDPITGVVDVEYTNNNTKVIKTVWHRKLHNNGNYGTNLISDIIGISRGFSYPKSLYATKDSLASVIKDKKNALVLDFFAGSGTTLHAINLLNAEDGGKRRCILVTNNEVSDDESSAMKKPGIFPGSPEWESRGICQSVTWPRTINSIKGKRADNTPISGEYYTTLTQEKTRPRNFHMIPILASGAENGQHDLFSNNRENGASISMQQKKQIIALLGKEKIPQSAVSSDPDYIADEKYSTSILFNVQKTDEYIDALRENEHVSDIYIASADNRQFKLLKERISSEIGDLTVQEPLKIPMSYGFKTNAAYFRLGFLDRTSVSLGEEFSRLVPILWLKSGGKGICPKVEPGEADKAYYIFPKNGFAILQDEGHFRTFREELAAQTEIGIAYLITNSESSYKSMAKKLMNVATVQLYKDYLDNFSINHEGSR